MTLLCALPKVLSTTLHEMSNKHTDPNIQFVYNKENF